LVQAALLAITVLIPFLAPLLPLEEDKARLVEQVLVLLVVLAAAALRGPQA
jgi:hypothetical protein